MLGLQQYVQDNLLALKQQEPFQSTDDLMIAMFTNPQSELRIQSTHRKHINDTLGISLHGSAMVRIDYEDDKMTALYLHKLMVLAISELFDHEYKLKPWIVKLLQDHGFQQNIKIERSILLHYLLYAIPTDLEKQIRYDQIHRVILLSLGDERTSIQKIAERCQQSPLSIAFNIELFEIVLKQLAQEEDARKIALAARFERIETAIANLPLEASTFSKPFGGTKIQMQNGGQRRVCGTYAEVYGIIKNTRRKSSELSAAEQEQTLLQIQQQILTKDLATERELKLAAERSPSTKAQAYRRVTLAAGIEPAVIDKAKGILTRNVQARSKSTLIIPIVQDRKDKPTMIDMLKDLEVSAKPMAEHTPMSSKP